MPTDQRFGLENFQSVQNSGGQVIEPGKDEAIQVAEGCSFCGFAPQHIELVSKDKDFTLQCSPRPEQANHGAQDQPVEIVHRDRLLPIRKKPPAVLGLR